MSGAPIIYALVARDGQTLCDYTHEEHSGNFATIARKIMQTIDTKKDSKTAFVFDNHTFNFRVCNEVVFMCMAEQSLGRSLPFVYLKEVSDAFFQQFPGAQADDDFSSFGEVLRAKALQYEAANQDSTVNQIKRGLSEAKDVMRGNIEKVLQRGEQIEALVDRTEELNASSSNFRGTSRALRRNLCWQNMKMRVFAGCVALFLVYLVAASFCGITLNHC